MDLFIRSQDKTTLMKVYRLDIDYSSGLYLIKADGFGTLLATYKSEVRALEVLDEIDKCMSNAANNGLNIARYNMPEELY